MTDDELTERLKAAVRKAHKVFPQAVNNSFAMGNDVRRLLDLLEAISPAEYSELHSALWPEGVRK